MARKRMIDPEFWLDEGLATLSVEARLLYIGLWGICDDNYATFPNRPLWVKAQVFPYDSFNIETALKELTQAGKILPFTYEDQPYYYIKNFFKYQRVDRPSSPKYPEYPHTTQQPLAEDSPSTRSEVKLSKDKLREVKLRERTPAEEAREFFSNPEFQTRMVKTLTEMGVSEQLATNEIRKFINHWTELNKSGTKQKWELENTFELKRRLSTWFNNAAKWSSNRNNQRKAVKL